MFRWGWILRWLPVTKPRVFCRSNTWVIFLGWGMRILAIETKPLMDDNTPNIVSILIQANSWPFNPHLCFLILHHDVFCCTAWVPLSPVSTRVETPDQGSESCQPRRSPDHLLEQVLTRPGSDDQLTAHQVTIAPPVWLRLWLKVCLKISLRVCLRVGGGSCSNSFRVFL